MWIDIEAICYVYKKYMGRYESMTLTRRIEARGSCWSV